MDNESEVRPLLHSYENQSWRSRARKRCLRIPSELTVTGIILGLFLIVVTLLLALENVESDNREDLPLASKLLASPMKFNKKIEDKTWQDKKDYMKNKQSEFDHKWDNVNKGWKKPPSFLGKTDNSERPILKKNEEDTIELQELLEGGDEYGKEIDDSLESPFNLQMGRPSPAMEKFGRDADQIKYLLHSGIKWRDVDDGWKALSRQGWSDKQIRVALFKALNEKRQDIKNAEYVLKSPMNFDDILNKMTNFFKELIPEGNKDIENKKIKSKEADRQKNINDEWKDKMSILQSPKSQIKKIVKDDPGWQRLDDLGWKNKEIEEALIEAWTQRESVAQSPMKLPGGLWGKTTDFLRNLLPKGPANKKSDKPIEDEMTSKNAHILKSSLPISSHAKWKDMEGLWKNHSKHGIDEQKSQKEMNDEWANEFNKILQSPRMSYEEWKEIGSLRAKHSKDDWKTKVERKHEKENKPPLQSPMKFDGFLDDIVEMIKDREKGNKEAEKQKDINDKFQSGMEALHTSKQTDKKWKQVDEHWKTLIEHERNTHFGRNDGDSTSSPKHDSFQHSTSFYNSKWDKIDDGLKKLSEQGWKDKDIQKAVYDAYKEGDKLLQSATGHNDMKWKKVNEGWKKLSNKSVSTPTRCPFSKAHTELLPKSPVPNPPINCALVAEYVKRKLGDCIDLSFLPKECKPSFKAKCFATSKYRNIDGTCNNEMHPTWGKSGTPFIRMMDSDYADDVSTIRLAKDGGPLPNPRYLSLKLYSKRLRPDADTSVIFMYYGLIVDHDIIESGINSDAIPCCDEYFIDHPEDRPIECLQIDVPLEDPFYGPKGVRCLNLVRSFPVTGICGGIREQLNKATSFLDASIVYGSNINHANELRSFSRGQHLNQMINNTPFMPNSKKAGFNCGTSQEPLPCFDAGDSRVNMITELTTMHTLWYREHNRLATELYKMNPQLTDEVIFQEARKILIAEMQHITFKEFLPILLGEKVMDHYELTIDKSKTYEGYDDTIDPSVFNVIGAAAFRFGHSLAQDMQDLLDVHNATRGKVPLHELFFNARLLYHHRLDRLIRGAAFQRTHDIDSYITPEIRGHLFQPEFRDYGYDLAAIGVQRGRDHGLAPYIKWRSACSLSEIKSFDDLYTVMSKERADMLKQAYRSVEDIDLIPAALAEYHEEGALLGPTYACLLGRQFQKTRKGDRFWFEIQNEISSFKRDQLDEIYKSNMARIICDNSDNITEIQRNPFKVPSRHNIITDCDAIPNVDLSKWK